jgi:hypothetical protein
MATHQCIASIKTPYIHQRGFSGHRLGKTRFSHNHTLQVTDRSAGLDLTRPNRHNAPVSVPDLFLPDRGKEHTSNGITSR